MIFPCGGGYFTSLNQHEVIREVLMCRSPMLTVAIDRSMRAVFVDLGLADHYEQTPISRIEHGQVNRARVISIAAKRRRCIAQPIKVTGITVLREI